MIGKKLHLLLKELTVSHSKTLLHRCNLSNDKRFNILKSLISIRHKSEDEINDFIQKEVKNKWKSVSEKEDALKWRRLNHFLTEQIELVIIELYLEKNTSYKNSILAQALENNGNYQLVENYFQSVRSSSIKEHNKRLELQSLEGLIRISSLSQSNEEIEKTLNLNEEYLQKLTKTSNQKTADYYYTISNVYLDKTEIVRHKKDELILSIFQLLNIEKNSINRALLFASLAKLHCEDDRFDFYFDKANKIINNVEKESDFLSSIKQQFLYLKIRVSFFDGWTLTNLQKKLPPLTNDDIERNQLNLNCIFYALLFEILGKENNEMAEKLDEYESVFKNYPIYFLFLKSVVYYQIEEPKKAIKLLNQMIYSDNYFFSIFSRLLLIKIQIELKNIHLAKSYILSTQKLITQKQDNILGKKANEATLLYFKNKVATKKTKGIEFPKMSILHLFFISEIN